MKRYLLQIFCLILLSAYSCKQNTPVVKEAVQQFNNQLTAEDWEPLHSLLTGLPLYTLSPILTLRVRQNEPIFSKQIWPEPILCSSRLMEEILLNG